MSTSPLPEFLVRPAEELVSIVADWNAQTHSARLIDDIKRIQSETAQPNHLVDAIVFGIPDEKEQLILSQWLLLKNKDALTELALGKKYEVTLNLDTFNLVISLIPYQFAGANVAGNLSPSVMLAILCGRSTADQMAEYGEKLDYLSETYPAVVFVNLRPDVEWDDGLIQRISKNCLFSSKIIGENMNNTTLQNIFANQLTINHLNLLKADAYLNSLESVYKTMVLYIQKEERSHKSKNALNQQDLIKLQADSMNEISDIPSRIKTLVQQQLGNFERGISANLDNYFRATSGTFFKSMATISERIDKLSEEKKAKTTALTISPENMKEFTHSVYDIVYNMGINDLKALHDTFSLLKQEIEKLCEHAGLPSPPINFKSLTSDELQQMLEAVVQIDKPYYSEINRKGGYEYFMAVRKYQMLFIMMASAIGITSLRSKIIIYGPLTLVLLGYGVYTVMNSVEKERKEQTEKELKKAQESILAESKRMAGDITRQWSRIINEHLRYQITGVTDETEAFLKTHLLKKKSETDDEKKRLQRILQGIEQSERKLELIKRNTQNWQKTLQKSRNDVKTAYYKNQPSKTI